MFDRRDVRQTLADMSKLMRDVSWISVPMCTLAVSGLVCDYSPANQEYRNQETTTQEHCLATAIATISSVNTGEKVG